MTFDAYEFIGVIIPGALPTLAATLLFPELQVLMGGDGMELGGLGLFVIVSFIAGHLVQVLANGLEWIWNRAGQGLQDMPFSKDRGGVPEVQWSRFLEIVESRLRIAKGDVTRESWQGVRMSAVALLSDEGDRRLEAFNRTYGLCRGISAGCLITAALTAAIVPCQWIVTICLLLAAILMDVRRRHFSRLYLRELVARVVAYEQRS